MFRADAATDQAMLTAAYWQIAWSVAGTVVALAGVVLAFVGLVISRRTVRDQRAAREFPSDKAYADEFADRMRSITADRFLGPAGAVEQVTAELRGACDEYAAHVTDAGLVVEGFFAAQRRRISELAAQRETMPDDHVDGLRIAIDAILF